MNRRRARASATVLMLAAWLAAPAMASRFWPPQHVAAPVSGERGDRPVQTLDGSLPAAPGGPVRLLVHDLGSHYEVVVLNPLPGPVQVRLSLTGGAGLHPVPALPTDTVLGAGTDRTLARLYRDDAATIGGFDLDLVQVPGDPRARPLDFPYRLPFEGAPVRVHQGFDGRYSHDDAANRHALDFALAEGTPVLAAREGVVFEVIAGEPRTGYGLRILHDDGSMAVYAHLLAGSAQVRPGERVHSGQRIARSGNTGFSTAPHLHFAVQANAGMQLRSIPFRMVGDDGELKFARESDVPDSLPRSRP